MEDSPNEVAGSRGAKQFSEKSILPRYDINKAHIKLYTSANSFEYFHDFGDASWIINGFTNGSILDNPTSGERDNTLAKWTSTLTNQQNYSAVYNPRPARKTEMRFQYPNSTIVMQRILDNPGVDVNGVPATYTGDYASSSGDFQTNTTDNRSVGTVDNQVTPKNTHLAYNMYKNSIWVPSINNMKADRANSGGAMVENTPDQVLFRIKPIYTDTNPLNVSATVQITYEYFFEADPIKIDDFNVNPILYPDFLKDEGMQFALSSSGALNEVTLQAPFVDSLNIFNAGMPWNYGNPKLLYK